jgi:hypothetical protein
LAALLAAAIKAVVQDAVDVMLVIGKTAMDGEQHHTMQAYK